MNLVHMQTLAAIARTGSFVAAARALHLPPSTVTGHIAALESVLGLQLIQRTTRALRMTAIGSRLAEDGQAIADVATQAIARLAAERSAPGGIVRLSLPFALSHDVIAPAIGRFLAAHPGITVDLHLDNAREDLIGQGIDLAIRTGPLTGHTLFRRVLFRAETGFYAAPSLAQPMTLADLATLPHLGFSAEMTLKAVGRNGPASVTLRPRMIANDPKTLARAAAAGAGVALLPTVLVRDLVVDHALVRVLTDHATDPVDVSLVSHGLTSETPAAALLAAFLVAEAARLGAAD
jgi:DNA-binding transcriptional LysR family regulator